jgi:hypothetical protein
MSWSTGYAKSKDDKLQTYLLIQKKTSTRCFFFRKFGEFNYSQPKSYNQNVLSYTRKFVAEFCLGYPVGIVVN